MKDTYWHTSRDASPSNGFALVLGVQDSTLKIILDTPAPGDLTDPPGPYEPTPRVAVTTDQGESLRWHGSTGLGIGGIGGRYLHVAVFDLPPPESECLHISVTVGEATALTVRALPVRSGP